MKQQAKTLGLILLALTMASCASDGDYYAEVPSQFLVNEHGQYIDQNGKISPTPVENPYYKKFQKNQSAIKPVLPR